MAPFKFLLRFDRIVIVPNGFEKPVIFRPDEEARFSAWLVSNRGKNVYFQPNGSEPRRMDKAEILQGRWLHVDIDSDADGKPLAFNDAEKERIAKRLKDDGVTLLVDSGGGLQAYLELSGFQPREQIERACRALIQRYAPHDLGTWNIDRLLRVPGTMNQPNAKKRAQGRKPVKSRLLFDTGAVHDFEAFELAEPEKVKVNRKAKPENFYQFGQAELAELPELPAPLTALIRDLDDSELPATADRSKSAKAWRAILHMLKHGLKPETVKAICTSRSWAIGRYYHAWSRDHGVGVAGEVERQIRKAMSAFDKPTIRDFFEDE